ncbi:unnamed protein product [Trichobilharzia regenti]|nr:unnamed protein product [Trichobilharzia regenti]
MLDTSKVQLESWDAEPASKTTSKPASQAPPKLSLAERIKLKEEQKRKEREEKLKRQEEELKQSQPATELQREKLAEEAELGLLKDTFGPTPVQNVNKETIDSCCPTTKEEFNRLHELLVTKITTIQKSPHYSAFAESLIRDLTVEMEIDTLRSVNTAINALISEKQKLVKVSSYDELLSLCVFFLPSIIIVLLLLFAWLPSVA